MSLSENFNEKQTDQFNQLLSEMPEIAKDKELANTEKLDTARIEWLQKMGELLSETKTSLDALKTSEELDGRRLQWWMEQAGIDLDKINENKNNN